MKKKWNFILSKTKLREGECVWECFYFMQINLSLTDREFMLKQQSFLPFLPGTFFSQCIGRDHGQKEKSCVKNLTFPAFFKCDIHARGQSNWWTECTEFDWIYYALLMCQEQDRLCPGKSCLFHNNLMYQVDYQHFKSPSFASLALQERSEIISGHRPWWED